MLNLGLEFQSRKLEILLRHYLEPLCSRCRYSVAELCGHPAFSIMGLTRRVCNCSEKSSLLIYTILTNCTRHGNYLLANVVTHAVGPLIWTESLTNVYS